MTPIWKYREEKALEKPIGYFAEKGGWRSIMFDTMRDLTATMDRQHVTGYVIRAVRVTPKFGLEVRRG